MNDNNNNSNEFSELLVIIKTSDDNLGEFTVMLNSLSSLNRISISISISKVKLDHMWMVE